MARKSVLAGTWYPASANECEKMIHSFEKMCPNLSTDGKMFIGGIVPHAGWVFSGAIACNVIRYLSNDNSIDTCFIFGKHLRESSANFIMTEGCWDTPFGPVEIDSEVASAIFDKFKFNLETEDRYEPENTIEVQLGFIKYYMPNVKIVPIGAPPRESSIELGEKAAEVSKHMSRNSIFIGSTDLTHYGANYNFTPKGDGKSALEWVKNENDMNMVKMMLEKDKSGILSEAKKNYNACCSGGIIAAISACERFGYCKGELLNYSTSYDIRPSSSFVGYAGILYYI